tara:strand:- start:226 stop:726 length:501 start_codon:yes stop_codon:yes gene_type:complete
MGFLVFIFVFFIAFGLVMVIFSIPDTLAVSRTKSKSSFTDFMVFVRHLVSIYFFVLWGATCSDYAISFAERNGKILIWSIVAVIVSIIIQRIVSNQHKEMTRIAYRTAENCTPENVSVDEYQKIVVSWFFHNRWIMTVSTIVLLIFKWDLNFLYFNIPNIVTSYSM